MKYLILFDIDGTLLKFKHGLAKELFASLISELFSREVPDDAIPDFHGKTDLQIIMEITKNLNMSFDDVLEDLPVIWSKMLKMFETNTTEDNITILPGVCNLLRELSNSDNCILGLLTGNFYENAFLKLKAVGLDDYFKFGAFGSDSHDRNLLPPLAIKRANEFFGHTYFNNKNTIIIGDTFRDAECAVVNNIPVICVSTGYQTFEELGKLNPDGLFRDLSDTESVKNKIFEIFDEKNNNCN